MLKSFQINSVPFPNQDTFEKEADFAMKAIEANSTSEQAFNSEETAETVKEIVSKMMDKVKKDFSGLTL